MKTTMETFKQADRKTGRSPRVRGVAVEWREAATPEHNSAGKGVSRVELTGASLITNTLSKESGHCQEVDLSAHETWGGGRRETEAGDEPAGNLPRWWAPDGEGSSVHLGKRQP